MPHSPPHSATQESQTGAVERRAKGEFVRGISGFRHTIGDPNFPAEPNRYHLFVALNCPWCHRVIMARNLLGLQNSISMDVVFPTRTNEDDPQGANLWEFNPNRTSILTAAPLPECTFETATGKGYRLVRDIYRAQDSDEQSVPILFDKKTGKIVNNESAEIIRILDKNATALGSNLSEDSRPLLYPATPEKRTQIETLNQLIYVNINNGAYKAGFSSDQTIYTTAFDAYFNILNQLNDLLSDGRPFLTGNTFNEVDLRLYPTLYRHDPIYYLRMKLNAAKIYDYPHLWRWICRVYALNGVPQSSALTHCRQGYFGRSWNGTIPKGPLKPLPYPEAYRHPNLAHE